MLIVWQCEIKDVQKLIRFINQEHFDLFFWKVRFFKENVKEEYHFVISSATGEIISYRHVIDETASRKIIFPYPFRIK